jgi:hypothetical protein
MADMEHEVAPRARGSSASGSASMGPNRFLPTATKRSGQAGIFTVRHELSPRPLGVGWGFVANFWAGSVSGLV